MLEKYPIKNLTPEEFPLALREIPQAPKKLHIRGKLPPSGFKRLCVVGSRKYSDYGKIVCEQLIKGLAGYPIVIISGLALGIDSIAHESAIKAGITTIAVPGSGLGENVLYPRSNSGLAYNILEHGGCLLSEFDDDFRATDYSFPQRNRIMAGLSEAVLVIEAEKESGTLITARLATDYNKDVLTVPGSIFSSTSDGPLMLLRLGATPIATSEDILEALHIDVTDTPKTQALFEDLSSEERLVVDALHSPRTRDELLESTTLDPHVLAQTMTLLELKGIIKEIAGKVYLA